MLNFIKVFYASFERIMWFLSFIEVVYDIDWFVNVEIFLWSWEESNLIRCKIFLFFFNYLKYFLIFLMLYCHVNIFVVNVLSHSVVYDSLWPNGLKPAWLFCLWGSQARILEGIVMPSYRVSSQPRDQT